MFMTSNAIESTTILYSQFATINMMLMKKMRYVQILFMVTVMFTAPWQSLEVEARDLVLQANEITQPAAGCTKASDKTYFAFALATPL